MIEILNQINLLAFQVLLRCSFDVGHEALISDCGSLIIGRKKRAAVVGRAAKGDGRIDGDIARQILIVRAQAL